MQSKLGDLAKKRDVFLTLSIALLIIVLLQSFVLIKTVGNTKVVLIPMPLKQTGWIDKQGVSVSYLTEMTRYYSTLFLNISPSETDDQMQEILHFTAPAFYGALKAALLEQKKTLERKHISTWFSPVSVRSDVQNLTADITGDLHILVGSQETEVKRVTYRTHYVYKNGLLLIASFNEVKNEK